MSELEDLWHDQEQYTPRGVADKNAEIDRLRKALEGAQETIAQAGKVTLKVHAERDSAYADLRKVQRECIEQRQRAESYKDTANRLAERVAKAEAALDVRDGPRTDWERVANEFEALWKQEQQRAEKAERELKPWVDYHKDYETKLDAMRQRAERAEAQLEDTAVSLVRAQDKLREIAGCQECDGGEHLD